MDFLAEVMIVAEDGIDARKAGIGWIAGGKAARDDDSLTWQRLSGPRRGRRGATSVALDGLAAFSGGVECDGAGMNDTEVGAESRIDLNEAEPAEKSGDLSALVVVDFAAEN